MAIVLVLTVLFLLFSINAALYGMYTYRRMWKRYAVSVLIGITLLIPLSYAPAAWKLAAFFLYIVLIWVQLLWLRKAGEDIPLSFVAVNGGFTLVYILRFLVVMPPILANVLPS